MLFLKQDLHQNNILIGFHTPTDSSHVLDFKGIDIQDKIVFLVDESMDHKLIGIKRETELYGFFRKLRLSLKPILEKKPRAIFITSAETEELAQNEIFNKYRNTPQMGFDPSGIGKPMALFLISPNAISNLMTEIGKPMDSLIKNPSPIQKDQEIHLNIPLKIDDVSASDVLGYMEGSDLKNEVLILSAHYDHLGKHDGKIYHGADDDGSGSAALMTLADAFSKAKKAGHGPRRSILFLANVGEEKGLLGSYYYSEHPVFPIANTITDLNIDMIGRVDSAHIKDTNYVYVIGSGKLSSGLQSISEQINSKFSQLSLDYTYDSPTDPNQFYYRSDHYNFARLGIPIIFYFNGVHEDYHQPTDVIEKINFGIYHKRAQLVFFTAWDLANRNDRPLVDRKSDFK